MKKLPFKLVSAFSALLFLSISVSAVSIEVVNEPFDSSIVSPESNVAQVVRLVDAEGSPINSTELKNRSSLDFNYVFNGNESSMEALMDGYYYAHVETGSLQDTFLRVQALEYEVIDNTISGELNETEVLYLGNLDVDIKSNYTGDLEAGEEIDVEATVEDLTDYGFVDVDGSNDLSNEDVVVVDRGGFGTFSKGADTLFAGSEPENMAGLEASNPWSDTEHQIALNDSDWEDGGWSSGSDLIVLDRNSGGTVSTRQDRAVNTGSDADVDAKAGQELMDFDDVSSDIFYASSNEELEQGDPVVYDNDSDGVLTTEPDLLVAGEEPPEGAEITHHDTMPDGWMVSSYDAEEGDSWDPSEDFLTVDSDEDGFYTARADIVLGGEAPTEGTNLSKEGYSSWVDEDPESPTAGDLEVHDETEGNEWDPSEDAIWIENGSEAGYQPGEDTAVVPETIETDTMPTETAEQFDQWTTVSAYDEAGGSGYDPAVDAIIRDFHGGGTYSKGEDEVVAGTVPTGFSGGNEYSESHGFVNEWSLDVRRPVDTGSWSSSRDTILVDRNDTGTYSPTADYIVNSGGESDFSPGTTLRNLNSVPAELKMWVDVDGNGRYSEGDEIFVDRDEDGQYTARADEHLAGVSLGVAGEGTPLRTYNNWQNEDEPVLFYDQIDGDGWSSSLDAIVHDTDSGGVYTARGDVVVQGTQSEAEEGSTLYATDRTNFTTPDLNAWVTSGQNTTEPVEMGRDADGNYSDTLEVPESHDTDMVLQIEAEDQAARIYGLASRIIETRAQGIGFDALKSGIDINADRRGNYSKNVTLENYLDTENTINISISEEIENITYPSTDQVNISSQGNSSVNFVFNLSELEEMEGEIEFTEVDTGISESVDVDVITPDCVQRTELICRKGVENLFIQVNERQEVERSLELQNIGQDPEEVEVSLEGNISDYIELENESFELNRSETFELTFDPRVPGNFSGTVNLQAAGETMEVETEMIANFTERESGFDVTPSTLEVQNLPRGNDYSREMMITNTGTLDINRMEISSDGFQVSSDTTQAIEASESGNFTVTLQQVESESGTLNLTAETSQSNVSREVDVTVSLVTPLSEMTGTINSRVSTLRSQANSSSTLTRLSNLQAETNAIETQWDQGNYARAQEIYQSTTSTLDSIQSQVGGTTGGTQQPGNGGSTDPSGEQNGGGGGGMIIVVLILLILILGAGFVVYTSYYPEEGDPLYDVLGEKQ